MNHTAHNGETPLFFPEYFLIVRYQAVLQSGVQENLNGAVPRMGG